jgi:hypothetical protein
MHTSNHPCPTVCLPPCRRRKLKESMLEVVRSPTVWLLAFSYFFVYMVRQGSTSWLVFYLLETKGVQDAAQAAMTVSGEDGYFALHIILDITCYWEGELKPMIEGSHGFVR